MNHRDQILIAIGRAYAQPRNAAKQIDVELANDIADAITTLDGGHPEPATPDVPRTRRKWHRKSAPEETTRAAVVPPKAIRKQDEDGYLLPVRWRCCGSHGKNHRKSCQSKEAIEQREQNSREQSRRPQRKISHYRCTNCNEEFDTAKDKLDATCPACKSLDIVSITD
jgi:hypothetical protein